MCAAQMEYLVTKDRTIAQKIFDLGMKKFGDEPGYILTYLDHLTHINGQYYQQEHVTMITGKYPATQWRALDGKLDIQLHSTKFVICYRLCQFPSPALFLPESSQLFISSSFPPFSCSS